MTRWLINLWRSIITQQIVNYKINAIERKFMFYLVSQEKSGCLIVIVLVFQLNLNLVRCSNFSILYKCVLYWRTFVNIFYSNYYKNSYNCSILFFCLRQRWNLPPFKNGNLGRYGTIGTPSPHYNLTLISGEHKFHLIDFRIKFQYTKQHSTNVSKYEFRTYLVNSVILK